MSFEAYAQPVIYADESARSAFLRKVGTWLAGGLTIAAVSAALSAMTVAPMIFGMGENGWMANLVLVFGAMFVAQNVGRGMVRSNNKTMGFVLGTSAMGVAMGPLILVAVMVAGGTLEIVMQAGGLTALTVFGMCAYLWSGPKNLSMIGSAMSVLGLPALILMGISFVFPIGGPLGIMVSMVFVALSAGGLVYNLNQVLHVASTTQVVEAAYEIALGVIVLFWNVLSLLIRMRGRD